MYNKAVNNLKNVMIVGIKTKSFCLFDRRLVNCVSYCKRLHTRFHLSMSPFGTDPSRLAPATDFSNETIS